MRRLAAVAVTLGLLLSGCAAVTPQPDEQVSAELAPFYTQRPDWTRCHDGFECATVKAPLDWANPSDGSISLAVIRHKATGRTEGSLLVNPGGPGGSGVDFVRDSLDYAVAAPLKKNYDIVGFDPRGVGASTPVTCFDASGMDDYLYGITPGVRGSDSWIAATAQSQRELGQACKSNTGPLLAFIDTVSAARDLDVLRAVLDDSVLNYLGYSYGTALGAKYAELYPDKVGRMVLDGAVDPAKSYFEVSVAQAQGFESALRAYLTNCLQSIDCPFIGETVDGAMSDIRALLDAVDAKPIRATDGRKLGGNSLLTAIVYPLYSRDAWDALSKMFASVKSGNADLAMQFADGYYGRNADGTYRDNSSEAFIAITCLDYPVNADVATMTAQRAELEAAAPTIGTYFAYGDLQCAEWPGANPPARAPATSTTTAPIVVIGTTNDPATPYQWAVNLASELPTAVLVTYNGEGHTAYNKSNACVSSAVDDFFVKGIVPQSGLTC